MYSRRAIVLAVLVSLAFIATTAKPWMHGGRLLASKYADEFFIGPGYEDSLRAVDDSFRKEFDISGIRRVQAEVSVGDISVTTADDGKISVEGERIAYGPTEQAAQDRLRYVCLDAVKDGDTIRIVGAVMQPEPSLPDQVVQNEGSTSIVLRVPPGLAVDLRTQAGRITLVGLEGEIQAYTHMGSITARSTTGPLTARTSAGRITVTDAIIEGDLLLTTSMGDIEFDGSLGARNHVEVSAGRVQMTVPRSTCVRLDAATNAGNVDIRLPVTGTKSEAAKSSAVGILGEGQPTGDLKIRVSMGEISISGR
jgi:hypothetical protein